GVRLPRGRGPGLRHAGGLIRHPPRDQSPAGVGKGPDGPEGGVMAAGAHSGALEELDSRPARETTLSALARRCLIGLSVAFLAALLLAPLAVVFASAFHKGLQAYFQTLADRDAQAAIRLTLLTALV